MDKLILELPNFVPKELCDEIIERFESDSRKQDGVIMLGSDRVIIPDMKSSKEIFISATKGWEDIDHRVSDYVDKAVNIYFDHLRDEFDHNQSIHTLDRIIKDAKTIDDGYSIQRQSKGDKYGWHYDGGIGTNNFILFMIYLNSVPFSEGGETEFSNGRKIIPECGKVMMCPASWTFPHRGNEVKNTTKYTCVTKIHMNSNISN